MGCVDEEDRMANITPSAITQMDEEIALQYVRSGNSEQLHSSFFMWWEENVTQTFLMPRFKETVIHAGQER
jgi:hypothetical protein